MRTQRQDYVSYVSLMKQYAPGDREEPWQFRVRNQSTPIDCWERSFFGSEFTHAGDIDKHTSHPAGLLAMWQALEGKKRFPNRYLVGLKQRLVAFVNDNANQDS
jgi:hypothetical protein